MLSRLFFLNTLLGLTLAGATPQAFGKAGALYFVNNHPNGNFVVTHTIRPDGSLSYAGITSTGGVGLRGLVPLGVPLYPDAMYSQGSVVVTGGHLFTVNTGSNTIVMFNIDPKDPSKLTMVGKPTPSGGNFPTSIDVHPRNGNICVINTGGMTNTQCFTVDNQKGLSPIPNSNRPIGLNTTMPATGPAGSVSQILFTADGSHVVVPVKGIPIPGGPAGFIQTWAVDANGGLSATPVTSPVAPGGSIIYGATKIPNSKAFLVTDAALGYGIYDFSKGYDQPATGVNYNLTGQVASCWVAYSEKTKSYYISDERAPSVYEVSIDKNLKGKTLNEYKTQGFLIDVTIGSVGRTDYLYVLNAGNNNIEVYALNAPGQAKLIQNLSFAVNAQKSGATILSVYSQGMAAYII